MQVSLNAGFLQCKSKGTNTILNNNFNLEQIYKEAVTNVYNSDSLN